MIIYTYIHIIQYIFNSNCNIFSIEICFCEISQESKRIFTRLSPPSREFCSPCGYHNGGQHKIWFRLRRSRTVFSMQNQYTFNLKCEIFLHLAQIETDEAETWHTLRLLVYLSVRQFSAPYLSIYSSKFQMNLAAQIKVVCRHNQAQSYHYRNYFYSKYYTSIQ